MEKAKLGITRFFSGFFRCFPKLLTANLLFAVPLAVFIAAVYFVNKLTGLNNIFINLLPIIFSFPFFAGVTAVTRNIAREETNFSAAGVFFKAVKDNLAVFIFHGIVLYLAVFFCYSSITLYWRMAHENGIFYLAFAIAIIIAVIALFIFYNLPVMTVTFDLGVKALYKNCALMALGELKNNLLATLGLFLLFIFCATAFFASPNAVVLLIISGVLGAFLVPATASYIMNFYVYKDMAAVISDNSQKSEEIRKKIEAENLKRSKGEAKPEKLDFSGLDLDERKDPEEYLFFNGKMWKRGTLIKMRDKHENE